MIELKEMLRDIAREIVDNPDDVIVTSVNEDDKNIDFVLNVAEDDMGMIIGKHGRIAKAIRTVMKAAGNVRGKRINIEIR